MSHEFHVKGKRVSVDEDGRIYVNGSDTGIRQWKSEANRYSDRYGAEMKDLRKMSLEDVLYFKGYLPR